MKIVWIKHTTTIYDRVRLAQILHCTTKWCLVAIFDETKTENHLMCSLFLPAIFEIGRPLAKNISSLIIFFFFFKISKNPKNSKKSKNS
jgi:hypothetical protein